MTDEGGAEPRAGAEHDGEARSSGGAPTADASATAPMGSARDEPSAGGPSVRGVAMATLLPVVAYVASLIALDPGPRWHATYFANERLSGKPALQRRERVPYVRVYRRLYARELPKTGFSARWQTCLVVHRPMEITFQLTSADGSRLSLDGSVAVDDWGRHGPRTRAKKITVEAGVHPLRVDYFAHRKHPMFGLNVSIAGGPIQKLPPELLALPLDDQGTCPRG